MNDHCMRLAGTAFVALALLLVTGCGQKGSLYFPKDKPAASQPPQQN